jgi:hypothetical protein
MHKLGIAIWHVLADRVSHRDLSRRNRDRAAIGMTFRFGKVHPDLCRFVSFDERGCSSPPQPATLPSTWAPTPPGACIASDSKLKAA